MSRFTASAFHKPSPFNFPRFPLSPPHTDAEQPVNPSVIGVPLSSGLDYDPSQATESPASRLRRVSSLTYHNSGLRDRDRQAHKNYKSFIIIIPPPSFLEEHGQLGQTLSFGPRHRLSHGLLMPLFPTMYAQLNAIAREFNFPSTSGICLYLHHSDNGVTVTPRISDESWQMIWSHVFEAATPLSPGPPICGKVEFDIDFRHARWYGSWLSSTHRQDHTLDISMSMVPSTAPSISHFREESRNTFEEDQDSYAPRSAPAARHVPRKLSLVDRMDTLSARSATRSVRPTLDSPENVPSTTRTLSPIFQEDEPQTAKLLIEKKVESWIASAKLGPSPLASMGQISLEPANLPNSMNVVDLASNPAADELNLDDYAWSISSLGPNDYDPDSPMTHIFRIPSVHLANRLEGSVCLSPSICTSFGPSDYTLSPLPSPDSVPPTPDIACRHYEYVPLTPSTATSWGPPSVYLSSPTESESVYSVDLGQRAVFSPLPTPTTATSWGPASWPPSPLPVSRPPSVHLADRGEWSLPATPSKPDFPVPSVPSFGSSPSLPYPYMTIYPSVYPHFDLYPTFPSDALSGPPSSNAAADYPSFQLYPPVVGQVMTQPSTLTGRPMNLSVFAPLGSDSLGPGINDMAAVGEGEYFNLPWRPDSSALMDGPQELLAVHGVSHTRPFLNLYSYFETDMGTKGPAANPTRAYLPSKLPFLRAVQQIYEHFGYQPHKPELVVINLVVVYPDFNIYPAPYPQFDLYCDRKPVTPSVAPEIPSVASIYGQYPSFIIYPADYPWNLNEIYPPLIAETPSETTSFTFYPYFDLYPAVYPFLTPYPPVQSLTRSPDKNVVLRQRQTPKPAGKSREDVLWPSKVSTSHIESSERLESIYVRLSSIYPIFNLYPAVYPAFDLYPTPELIHASLDSYAPVGYPTFDLYAAVYPHFNIYPPIAGGCDVLSRPVDIAVAVQYPDFEIYPFVPSAVPSVHVTRDVPAHPKVSYAVELQGVKLSFEYPVFNLYPAIYPHFDIYPPSGGFSRERNQSTQSWVYPFFDIYPACYPHFSLYPAGIEPSLELMPVQLLVSHQYPFFKIYPSVYPFFELYPSVQPLPLVQLREDKQHQSRRKAKTHSELHMEIFPTGAVSTPSGNAARFSAADPVVRMSISRPRSGTLARPGRPLILPHADEKQAPPVTLTRSSSTVVPTHVVPQTKELERSHSASVGHKRDSIVLQRVKALNSSIEDNDNPSTKQPPISRNLLRSRYPFA